MVKLTLKIFVALVLLMAAILMSSHNSAMVMGGIPCFDYWTDMNCPDDDDNCIQTCKDRYGDSAVGNCNGCYCYCRYVCPRNT